ncbi:MAG: hypothetical protein COV60_01310 [Candidatus Magasanikbacteria bacterium CG11_big_fil_rev_8_21_14_0_20_43_7]|uniref:Uncharacterized protein n=1 Tax=Candidatus Magasanikbacteria bacterium CG11_big_fil_rev_8_21_14_0_20_43_7 TaxID=1974654 RepID=A0A2H0N2X6_9BACT|nr:MAG: hypothetical protein COV60_01310 [Candidatus Magasanikbacteria bacterium CG11_big_fil_rev_8_21_14_0_20_43_7]
MSKQKQQNIKRMLLLGFIGNTIAVVFIVLAVFSIFALFAQVFLQSYFADVALQSIRTQNPTKEINGRVISINMTLKTAQAIQKGYHSWTPLVHLIAETIPSDILIESVQFDSTAGTLSLSGVVPSREALLALKSSLESLDQIDAVTIPLSDLTKHDQIHISLTIPFRF